MSEVTDADRLCAVAWDAWCEAAMDEDLSARECTDLVAHDVAKAMGRDALIEFAKHKNWSLGYDQKVYGDDDDKPTHDSWVVWEETGGLNDREWLVVAYAATPLEAIIKAAGAS